MRRELPNRPNLEHLKTQAKDLLQAHRLRDPGAFERIRSALPAFAGATDERIADGPFALHDAQSTIAREYGFASFGKLRAHVLALAEPYPAKLIETLLGAKLVPEVEAALREVWTERDVEALEALPTPAELPLLAVRNALLSPGALAPFMVGRPSSLAALARAVERTPELIAVFAQRDAATEHPAAGDLHPTGCLAVVRRFQESGDGKAWLVLEGVRFITLVELVATEPFHVAKIAPSVVDEGDPAEIAALGGELRGVARKLALTLPEQRETALALIGQIDDVGRLSDLVIANLPCSVAEKAAYAAENDLAARLRSTIRLVEEQLAKTG
jgi:Lon protease-like protein